MFYALFLIYNLYKKSLRTSTHYEFFGDVSTRLNFLVILFIINKY